MNDLPNGLLRKKKRGSVAHITAIAEAVLRDLNIVSIALGEEDDAQIIFETLNGYGAELHATDLIRNFIFMHCRPGRRGGQRSVRFPLEPF